MNNLKTYKVCTKTVLDSSYPGLTFDKDGISSQYWDFQNTVKPNWHPDKDGQKILEEQIEKIKKGAKGKDYDCIIGLSGGLDSSYMLHLMVTKFDLKPLVFHVDGGWNSELAVHNIQVLVDKLGLDLYTEVINWEEMRDFQLAWFKAGVPHLDIPQDHAFIAVLYKFAEKYGIKTIFNGGNISTECVAMPYKYYYWGTDMTHIRDVLNKYGLVSMKSYPFSSVYRHKLYLKYFKGLKVIKPLNYLPYAQKHAIDLLQREYGWKPYSQKHFESRFTRFYEGYWLPTRFNFDVRRCQLSSLILTGQIHRNEALNQLNQPPYDLNTQMDDFEYVATKLSISTAELRAYHEMPKKYYWDFKNQHNILSLAEKLVSKLKIGRRGGAF